MMAAMTSYDARTAAEAVRLREAGDRDGLLALAARHPNDPAVAYQTAWLHDRLGLEAEAVPYYEAALLAGGLDDGLDDEDRLGAHTGLASTYRVLGRYDDALAAFDRALAEYPGDPALTAFRAIALHNLGRSGDAVADLLKLLTATSSAPAVARYRRALEHYADHLDETV
jgi:tetratricopeptide (TPR) repeat protein